MTGFQVEDRAKLRRAWGEQAIQAAMQSRWPQAVELNRNILELFPNDVDALNRLGRALREQGQFREARESYRRAVEVDPNNNIARRNLESLANVQVDSAPVEAQQRLDPTIFSAESGKSGNATIVGVSDRSLLARMAVGDQVYLHADGRALMVRNLAGETLGQVETRIAQRLIDLMQGGNTYAAALLTPEDGAYRIIIHETFRHPSQAGRTSFPPRGDAAALPRSYIKESLIRPIDYDDEDEDGDVERDFTAEVDPEAEDTAEPAEFDDEQPPE